jgi:hypothetical protein
MVVPALVYMLLLIFLFSVTSFSCVRKRNLKGEIQTRILATSVGAFLLCLFVPKMRQNGSSFASSVCWTQTFCVHEGLFVNIVKWDRKQPIIELAAGYYS